MKEGQKIDMRNNKREEAKENKITEERKREKEGK